MIQVQSLRNIMDKRTRERWDAVPGRPVWSYCPEELREDRSLRIVRNGRLVREEEELEERAREGDELIFYRSPGEGFLLTLAVSLIIAGISYGLQYLLAPSIPGRESDLETSPTFGFGGRFNGTAAGTRIPVVYGTHRVAPQIIQQFQRPARDTALTDADPRTGELHTLMVVSSGGLNGIEGIEDIRIDLNPVSDFKGVRTETRLGALSQEPIDGFNDTVTSAFKNVEITQIGGPAVFTTGDEIDAYELIFRFPAGLFRTRNRGGFGQRAVQILIEHREVGKSAWTSAGKKRITQSVSGAFDVYHSSERLDRARYEIRVTRLTEDETADTGQSTFSVLTVNEILEDTLFTHPRLATLAVRQLPTNQVQGRAPEYDCLVHGVKVRIFSDPSTHTIAWSDNPAWCLLDFLTSKKHGLGQWISDADVDIQSFVDWAAFCDQVVAIDSQGEVERQYRLDLVVDGSLPAIDVIKQMTVVGRANFFQRGTQWTVRVDEPREPVQLFTMGRIHRGSFSAAKRAKRQLANLLVGEYFDRDTDFDRAALPRPDETLTATEETLEEKVNLLGVTRRSQAQRTLNFLMLRNRLIRRELRFEAEAEAIAVEAGDVIKVAHDVPGWGFSGILRSVEAGGSVLILDREVTIEAGKEYEVTLIHPDDTIDVVGVTSNPQTTRRISVTGDLSNQPVGGLHYSFGELTRSTVRYMVRSIDEGGEAWMRELVCEEYSDGTYGTDLTILAPPSISRLPNPNRIPPRPRDLRLNERTDYAEDGSLRAAIDVHFTLPIDPEARAQVFWRELGMTAWQAVGSTVRHGFFSITENVETPGGEYEVSVVSVSPSGNHRHPDDGLRGEITTVGTVRQPDRVVNFRADRTATGLIFTWDPVNPLTNFDLDHYELRVGDNWDTAISIGQTDDTRFETASFSKGTHTFLVRAVNTAGRESALSAVIILAVPGRIGENVILTQTEEPTWGGNRENFFVENSKLVLDTEDEVVAWKSVVDTPTPFAAGLRPGGRSRGFRVSGVYTAAKFQVTSGNAVRTLISYDLKVEQIDTTLFWTSPDVAGQTWTGDFGKTHGWALVPGSRVRARVEMRFSTSGSGEEDFGPWRERPQAIEETVKWAQARIFVEVTDPRLTARITNFQIFFDVPEIVDSGTVTTDDAGTVAVAFAKVYNRTPDLVLQVVGANEGDEPIDSNLDNLGFDLEVKNVGTRVVRQVSWHTVGF